MEADALGEELDELAGVLGRLAPADWDRPTRCEGWDVTDVVLHLAQTNEMATASYSGRYAEVGAGLSAGLAPARDVDDTPDARPGPWRRDRPYYSCSKGSEFEGRTGCPVIRSAPAYSCTMLNSEHVKHHGGVPGPR